jgi:5-methylcytosine-specific restriction endonuclease McrA
LQVFDWVPEEQRQQIESFFAGRSDEVKQRIASSVASQHRGGDDPLKQGYPEYLKSKLWGKIKRRVFKRDGKLCRRCGGRATEVHHRSYADDVKLGKNDDQLASICEGCHTVIHFDGLGNKRSAEETDRRLLERNESTDFPTPKVDLRKRRGDDPAEWKRMSAVQREAWKREYNRLWFVGMLRRRNDPRVTDLNRKWL